MLKVTLFFMLISTSLLKANFSLEIRKNIAFGNIFSEASFQDSEFSISKESVISNNDAYIIDSHYGELIIRGKPNSVVEIEAEHFISVDSDISIVNISTLFGDNEITLDNSGVAIVELVATLNAPSSIVDTIDIYEPAVIKVTSEGFTQETNIFVTGTLSSNTSIQAISSLINFGTILTEPFENNVTCRITLNPEAQLTEVSGCSVENPEFQVLQVEIQGLSVPPKLEIEALPYPMVLQGSLGSTATISDFTTSTKVVDSFSFIVSIGATLTIPPIKSNEEFEGIASFVINLNY